MIQRCHKSYSTSYSRYGGRGISVCSQWHDSGTFFSWALANGYEEGLTIDRIDNNGNYDPSNCRWVDRYTQGNNKRNNQYLTIGGISLTMSEWAREVGIDMRRIWSRKKGGWSDREAVFGKPDNNHYLTIDGKTMTISEWACEVKIPAERIFARLKIGWPEKKAVFGVLRERRHEQT
jgi:hypothetical protein